MFTGKRLGTLLIVSLMVNAFLAGGLVTHFLRAHRGAPHHRRPDFAANEGHDRHGPGGERFERHGPVEGKLLRDVVQALGGPRDPRVRATLMQGHPQRTAHRRGMQRTEAGVRSALSAEPYEEARLTAALAELSRAASARQTEAQETLVQLGRQLTAEERAKLRGAPAGPKSP